MIYPKCEREFANLSGHIKKCKCLTDLEEIKKVWTVQVRIVALGGPSNPKTMCGLHVIARRGKELSSKIKFTSLIMDEIKDIGYTNVNNDDTKDYTGEINKILANLDQFKAPKRLIW